MLPGVEGRRKALGSGNLLFVGRLRAGGGAAAVAFGSAGSTRRGLIFDFGPVNRVECIPTLVVAKPSRQRFYTLSGAPGPAE